MQDLRSPAQEALEDIFFGQVVLIWARWFVVLAGVVLVLWTAGTVGELTANMLLVAALMVVNFFIHGRYLMGMPANRQLVLLASAIDLGVVTSMVWALTARPGVDNPFFVLYYPLLAAFAFVFQPRVTAAFTVLAVVVYGGTCVLADPALMTNMLALKALVMRTITLAAMGGLGTYYWRIQRERRRLAAGVQQDKVAPTSLQFTASGG